MEKQNFKRPGIRVQKNFTKPSKTQPEQGISTMKERVERYIRSGAHRNPPESTFADVSNLGDLRANLLTIQTGMESWSKLPESIRQFFRTAENLANATQEDLDKLFVQAQPKPENPSKGNSERLEDADEDEADEVEDESADDASQKSKTVEKTVKKNSR